MCIIIVDSVDSISADKSTTVLQPMQEIETQKSELSIPEILQSMPQSVVYTTTTPTSAFSSPTTAIDSHAYTSNEIKTKWWDAPQHFYPHFKSFLLIHQFSFTGLSI